MKKMIAVLVTMMMVCVFVFAGGSQQGQTSSGPVVPGKTWNGVDVSQPQVIKMYLLGDIPNDLNTVWTEINRKIGEKINATVELSFLSWAEHAQKYSLLFSGGEDFDLIFTASSWAHYETTAAMGGFHALDDGFISKYAPGIKTVVPRVAWDQAKINGKIYMIPQYQNEFDVGIYAMRGDLMRKYGYTDLTTLPQVIEFFTKVAADQAVTGISPRGNISGGMLYEYFQVDGYTVLGGSISELFLYHTQDASDVKPMYLLDWPRFEQYCNDMKRFYELGFWSKDSLASADQRQDGLLRGNSASMVWNLGSCLNYAVQANTAHPDWDVTLIAYNNALPATVTSYINNGVAINAASRKKERAMMALDLLYTDKEIHDMTVYGIPGVHWEPVGDKEYTKLPKSSDFGSYCTWGWNNMTLTREEYVPNPMLAQLKAGEFQALWNRNIKPAHPHDSISVDKSGITSEVAMVESIIAQYYTPLISGMAGDVPQAIAALKQQLTLAGIDKIIRVFNEQAASHVAANN